MKREERHHLKENPVARFVIAAQDWLANNRRSIVTGVGVVLVIVLAGAGYYAWSQVEQQRAGEMLARAMTVLEAPIVAPPIPADTTPEVADLQLEENIDETALEVAGPDTPGPEEFVQPEGSYPSVDEKLEEAIPLLLAVADTYPETQSAEIALYESAAFLVLLGRADEAIPYYEEVTSGLSGSFYAEMAVMGLAEAHLVNGDPEAAIGLLETKTTDVDSLIPVDSVLMRLGQAYRMAGNPSNALASFNRIVEEFPISVYYADAGDAIESLAQETASASSTSE